MRRYKRMLLRVQPGLGPLPTGRALLLARVRRARKLDRHAEGQQLERSMGRQRPNRCFESRLKVQFS